MTTTTSLSNPPKPEPKLTAAVSTPRNSICWEVIFYYQLDGRGPRLYSMPGFNLPCQHYEHARAVADAFNLSDDLDARMQRKYEQGVEDGLSRARNRPGDGDMGG